MDTERQFRLLSLILLGLCALVFIRQISAEPTSTFGFGGKFAANADEIKAGSELEILKPFSAQAELDSVDEVESINSGKTPTFQAGLAAGNETDNDGITEAPLAK